MSHINVILNRTKFSLTKKGFNFYCKNQIDKKLIIMEWWLKRDLKIGAKKYKKTSIFILCMNTKLNVIKEITRTLA